MSEDVTTGAPETGEGATSEGPETAAPETTASTEGQAAEGTTPSGTPDPEPIFDPQEFARLTKDLPPELQSQAQALQKSLQGAFTKKAQAIAKDRQKVEAYDAFNSDPVTNMQAMAKRFGYSLTRAEATQAVNDQKQDWEPQTWDEVMSKAEERAEQRIMQKLSPLLNQFQEQRKSTIESKLSEIDPSWQQYENDMMDTLKQHPTMANDPAKLYRMSVPPEVLESRAVQAALKKMETKVQSSKIPGTSTTNKTPKTALPDGPVSFQDAIAAARKQLAEQGIRPEG